MSLEQSDAASAAVQKRGHPRVTLDDLRAAISSIYFSTGRAVSGPAGKEDDALRVLTLCLLVTHSGFTIVGKSAPADPANYDEALGRKYAREDAERQLWPLMGFALRQRLYEAG